MGSLLKYGVPWRAGGLLIALAGAGFLTNQLPPEIFPGVHLVFGAVFALLAALRFGPVAGGLVGFVAALPTWWLWDQPLPFSALLYGLEGVAVGLFARDRRRSVIGVDLAYWLLLGSWLNLAFQLWITGLSFRLAVSIQVRSVLNGLLTAMLVELGLLAYAVVQVRLGKRTRLPSLRSILTVVLATLVSLPIIAMTVRGANTELRHRMADLRESTERDVAFLRHEIALLLDAERSGASVRSPAGFVLSAFEHDGASVVVADAQGRLIAGIGPEGTVGTRVPGTDLSGEPELARQAGLPSGTFVLRAPASEDRSEAVRAVLGGDMVSFASEPRLGWRVWIRRSLAPLHRRMLHQVTVQLVLLGICLVVVVGLSAGIARLLVAPLDGLRRAAERLAAGDLSVRPAQPRLLSSEVDSLFGSFDTMARNLESSWTRHEQLLEEVTRTQRDLEATFDAMTDAVVIVDTDDRIVRANRALRSLAGWVDVSASAPLHDLAHPDGGWEDCASCRARRMGQRATIFHAPQDNLTGRPVEVRVDPIRDASGRLVGAVQVNRDLSEVQRWEAEAARAEELLRSFVETAYDAVFVIDLEGRFEWANQRTLTLFGFSRRRVRGRSYVSCLHPEDRKGALAEIRRAAKGPAFHGEVRLEGEHGPRHLMVTLSPIHQASEPGSLLGIARDITGERMAAEHAKRDDKLRALGQLAAGVAHNFNNALTSVIGYTQIARAAAITPAVRDALELVEVAAMDAAGMVRRISRFAHAVPEEPLRPMSLGSVVRESLELTRSRWEVDAQVAGVRYEVRTADGEVADRRIAGDPSALREVLVNLIINALDAMPDGGVLTLGTFADGETVKVVVEDTGLGVTPELRERIFDPFFTTKGPRGVGMGLAVSYGIVQRHGGRIEVESEPGKGSRFEVVLPGIDAEAVAAPADVGGTAAEVPGGAGEAVSILLVEDEAPIRELMTVLLGRAGYRVTAAADGEAGMVELSLGPFDLVITDLAMPGADGMAVAREARRRQPGTKVVVVTGYGGQGLPREERVGRDGAEGTLEVDAYLPKPFEASALAALVRQVLAADALPSPRTSSAESGVPV